MSEAQEHNQTLYKHHVFCSASSGSSIGSYGCACNSIARSMYDHQAYRVYRVLDDELRLMVDQWMAEMPNRTMHIEDLFAALYASFKALRCEVEEDE